MWAEVVESIKLQVASLIIISKANYYFIMY